LKIKYHLCAEKSREIDDVQVIVQRTGANIFPLFPLSSREKKEILPLPRGGGEGLNEGKNYTGAYKLNRRL